jgi:hypothetical protein
MLKLGLKPLGLPPRQELARDRQAEAYGDKSGLPPCVIDEQPGPSRYRQAGNPSHDDQ